MILRRCDVVVRLIVAQVLFVDSEQRGELATVLASQCEAAAHDCKVTCLPHRHAFRLWNFADHESGPLVFTQRDKPRVPQVICLCPVDVFDGADELWPKPTALLHVFGGQTFSPSSFPGFGQVLEGTSFTDQGTESTEQATSRSRNKPGAHSGSVHQVFALVVANQNGIKVVGGRYVTTDDKLLAAVDPHLEPGARAPARL